MAEDTKKKPVKDSKKKWIEEAVNVLSSYDADRREEYRELFSGVENSEKARLYFRAIMRGLPVDTVSSWKEVGCSAKEIEEAIAAVDSTAAGDGEEPDQEILARLDDQENRIRNLEGEINAVRKKCEDVLDAAEGALRKALEMASRIVDERDRTIAELREQLKKKEGQDMIRAPDVAAGRRLPFWKRVFGDAEGSDDDHDTQGANEILMVFQQKYLAGNLYDDGQKDYLISLMEKGTPMKVIERVADPVLSVEEMERMRALYEREAT